MIPTIEQAVRVEAEDTLQMPRFALGINYWPRRSAMYMWERFDLGEIREDMARIAALRMQLVRFFLTWEAFAPAPGRIDAAMLRRLEAFVQTAADAGLQTIPTLFCGHMSGVNWLPAWALDTSTPHGRFRTVAGGHTSPFGAGDFYADPRLLDAQLLFARSVGNAVARHPGVYCWDLGNEFSNLRDPATPHDGARWSSLLAHELLESSGIDVTGGMHGEDLERDRNLRPSSMAAPWKIATMHGYSVYATFAHDRLDEEVVPFYADLMRSFSGKPLLFSEFGNPTCAPHAASAFACLSETEMATYATGVLERLHARGAIGALWWCWADYDARLADLPPFDRAPHELHFGIVRSDGSEKPVARALAEFSARCLAVREAPAPIAEESAYYASLPLGIHALYHRYRR